MADEPNSQVPEEDPATRPVTVTLPGETDALPQVKPADEKPRRITTRADDPNARHRRDDPDIDGGGIPEHLRKKLKTEQWKRHETQRHLDDALADNRRLRAIAGAASSVADDAALNHAKAETERAKAALKAAKEEGDIEKETEAMAALARWAPEAARLETAVAARGKRNGSDNGHDPDARPDGGRREAPRLDPRAEAWLEDNQDIMADPADAQVAVSINNRLLKEGLNANTDEFYEELDRRLIAAGVKDDDGVDRGNGHDPNDHPHPDDEPEPKPRTKTNGRAATPSSRGTMGKQPANRGEVTLSREDMEHARAMQMSPERMALGRLRAQGKIGADEHARQIRELQKKGK